jgi:tetratricopeptide (TPR) repeat protein
VKRPRPAREARFQAIWRVMILALAAAAPRPAATWSWTDPEEAGPGLPSLQEEFDQEVAAYRSQKEAGLTHQERIIALDRLISVYKPQGVNTASLESERDRLIVEEDNRRAQTKSVEKISSELFQLALQKVREGRFEDALRAVERAERLVPEDKSLAQMRRKLENVTAILPLAPGASKAEGLVRKAVQRHLEGEGARAVNALRYANHVAPGQSALIRLMKLMENEYPGLPSPTLAPGTSLVDYKLQSALEHVYSGQFLKAINECNEVLDLEPTNVLALTRLGSAYFAVGQKAQAQDTWRRALALDPGNREISAFLNKYRDLR